jgi:hypothetical protein
MRSLFSLLVFMLAVLTAAETERIVQSDTAGKVFDSVRVPEIAKTPHFTEVTLTGGFPAICKWMYQENMEKAHWLGLKWENKNLIEPINIVFIDAISKTVAESNDRLTENLIKAGYSKKPHHSSGYISYIGNAFYPQLPREKYHAFSNRVAEIDNNHGRIFGPYRHNGKYVYSGAFSREVIEPFSKMRHHYGSFDRARDELSQSLDKNSEFKIVKFINLNNTIVGDTENTTGDHDGVAVVLALTKQ